MSSKPSLLEQSCVIKGGLSCISGNAYNGAQYGVDVSEYVLNKMLASTRYPHVLCVSFDRTSTYYDHIKKTHPRLEVMASYDSDQSKPSTARERALGVLKKFENLLDNKLRDGNQSIGVAVVVHSLSEVVCLFGQEFALQWLLSIRSKITTLSAANTTTRTTSNHSGGSGVSVAASSTGTHLNASSEPSSSGPSVACVVVLHSSLHSQSFRSQVEHICQSSTTVYPNMGTYAEGVYCIVKTARRSGSTGKVQEATELFCKKYATLPVATGSTAAGAGAGGSGTTSGLVFMNNKHGAGNGSGSGVGVGHRDIEDSTDGDNNDPQSTSSSLMGGAAVIPTSATETLGEASKVLDNTAINASSTTNTSVDLTTTTTVSTGATALLGNTSITKQLVLFDRTDPEFDEDSDPDGDLDL